MPEPLPPGVAVVVLVPPAMEKQSEFDENGKRFLTPALAPIPLLTPALAPIPLDPVILWRFSGVSG